MYSNGYIPSFAAGERKSPWVQATQTGYREIWDNRMQTNISLEQKLDFITKGLRFEGRFGFDTNNHNENIRQRTPETWRAMRERDEQGNIIFQRQNEEQPMTQTSRASGDRRETLEAYLHYNRNFRKHHLGGTFKYSQDVYTNTIRIAENSTALADIKDGISKRHMGIAGRVSYNWNYRYFADFNFGYNGSENFADGHRFGFFPAFSVAWNVAEEKFVKKHLKWVDMFKIRYSYGKVGNDAIMDGGTRVRFPYLYTLDYLTHTDDNGNIVKDNIYNFGTSSYTNIFNGIHYTQLAARGVTWEVARKSDVGIDLVLFNNKFSMTVDYFYEKRTGQYSKRNFIPSMAGFESSPWANVGAVRVNGFDGNFSYNQKFGEVDLTVRGNITYSKNEVLVADEQFNTLVGEITTEVNGIVSDVQAKGAVFGKPTITGGTGNQGGELTKEQQEAIAHRESKPKDGQPF